MRLLKENQELEESKHLLSQKIRYSLDRFRFFILKGKKMDNKELHQVVDTRPRSHLKVNIPILRAAEDALAEVEANHKMLERDVKVKRVYIY